MPSVRAWIAFPRLLEGRASLPKLCEGRGPVPWFYEGGSSVSLGRAVDLCPGWVKEGALVHGWARIRVLRLCCVKEVALCCD